MKKETGIMIIEAIATAVVGGICAGVAYKTAYNKGCSDENARHIAVIKDCQQRNLEEGVALCRVMENGKVWYGFRNK